MKRMPVEPLPAVSARKPGPLLFWIRRCRAETRGAEPGLLHEDAIDAFGDHHILEMQNLCSLGLK